MWRNKLGEKGRHDIFIPLRRVLLSCLLLMGLAAAYLLFAPKVYRATCSIAIRKEAESYVWQSLPTARERLKANIVLTRKWRSSTTSFGVWLVALLQSRGNGYVCYDVSVDASDALQAVQQVHMFVSTWQDLAFERMVAKEAPEWWRHPPLPLRVESLAAKPERPTKLGNQTVFTLAAASCLCLLVAGYYLHRLS
ncbi:MAG: hypothetical protein QOE70_607 [Chthoniobacter sp.]|jgi:hypothetical protein|nr:hypothetical protein [Chthoniobacter sp.]